MEKSKPPKAPDWPSMTTFCSIPVDKSITTILSIITVGIISFNGFEVMGRIYSFISLINVPLATSYANVFQNHKNNGI